MSGGWPSSAEVHSTVRARIERLFGEQSGLTTDIGQRVMSRGGGVLGERPHSLVTVMVPGACMTAGGAWQRAVWPTVGAECMMAAADVFDDVADADAEATAEISGAVLLTAAAGLLSLAGSAIVRVVEDGASAATAVALADLFGTAFAQAANGQAGNLQPGPRTDPFVAYQQAAAKSGPLGSLIARLGARTATDDAAVVDLLGEFGRRQAVRSQLLNDARDAAPDGGQDKSDVRVGARTVPLAFVGSRGAPGDLDGAALTEWEARERHRVAAGGGLAAALALAEAERLAALEALDRLGQLACDVAGLRLLI